MDLVALMDQASQELVTQLYQYLKLFPDIEIENLLELGWRETRSVSFACI